MDYVELKKTDFVLVNNGSACKFEDWIKPKKIIQNGIATIVFWKNGTKTVIKLAEGEENDLFTAFCVAFTKRLFGSTSAINRQIEKTYLPSKEETEEYNEALKRITKFFNSFNRGKND